MKVRSDCFAQLERFGPGNLFTFQGPGQNPVYVRIDVARQRRQRIACHRVPRFRINSSNGRYLPAYPRVRPVIFLCNRSLKIQHYRFQTVGKKSLTLNVLVIDRQSLAQLKPLFPTGISKRLDVWPGRFRIDVVLGYR